MAYGKQHPKPRVKVTSSSLLRKMAGTKASKFHAEISASNMLETFLVGIHGSNFRASGNGTYKG